MSATKNLDISLRDVLSEIRSGLADKIRAKYQIELNKIQKTKKLYKFVDKKEKLELELKELETRYYSQREYLRAKISEAQSAIDLVDGVSEEEAQYEEGVILNLNNVNYRKTKSQLESVRKIIESIEATNYFRFLDVEKNTNTMYSLAITAKEKRNIIMSIQSRDWRSLGIELPQLPYFEKFDIEEGEIKLPATLQIEGKKED